MRISIITSPFPWVKFRISQVEFRISSLQFRFERIQFRFERIQFHFERMQFRFEQSQFHFEKFQFHFERSSVCGFGNACFCGRTGKLIQKYWIKYWPKQLKYVAFSQYSIHFHYCKYGLRAFSSPMVVAGP